ncbi:gp20 [Sphingomonas phage PAU]|uniref:gp20 n=1 Tax=Sphingomonas phage PAU TaxID=1150991 RepID=UPI0002573119|nr:gp20 [Sphingomonas phage PAU]AFF28018.1 gp20 [Sphingomonas phage PAU]
MAVNMMISKERTVSSRLSKSVNGNILRENISKAIAIESAICSGSVKAICKVPFCFIKTLGGFMEKIKRNEVLIPVKGKKNTYLTKSNNEFVADITFIKSNFRVMEDTIII